MMDKTIFNYVLNHITDNPEYIIAFCVNENTRYNYYTFEVFYWDFYDKGIEVFSIEINDDTPYDIIEYLKKNNMSYNYISNKMSPKNIKITDSVLSNYFQYKNIYFSIIFFDGKKTLLKSSSTISHEYELVCRKFDYIEDNTISNFNIIDEI